MPRQLGDLEDAVMTRVWQWNRPVTVREVLEDLQRERSIAYTTVMTVLDNLHQKGWVRREVVGRAYRYTAVSTRAAYSAALMNEAWSQSDNPAAALVAFFGMMSSEQREALNDAIRIVQRDTPETAEAPEGPAPAERQSPGKGRPPAAGEAPNAPAEGTAPDDSTPRADESGEQGTGQGRPPAAATPGGPQSDAERPAESPDDGFPGTTPQSTPRVLAAPPESNARPTSAPPVE
ncbi:BlaI/MecI/CopY family transcriptional regulator, partial [Streptomyces fradiae]|uniref:BlaI/MecI/CopY family transcriptional regulator n=1 Tax=Streptomyces fradiae TaxID=1906 RepID=UPI00358DA32A